MPGFGWKRDKAEHIAATEIAGPVYRADRFGAAPVKFPKNFYDLMKFSRILDQEETSACVNFAMTGAVDCRLRVLGFNPEPLSPCANYPIGRRMEIGKTAPLTDDGSIPYLVFESARRHGIPSAKVWPFDPKRINEDPPFDVFQQASQFRLSNVARIDATGEARKLAAMQAIYAMHPVPNGMMVGSDFMDYLSNRDPVDVETSVLGGHMTYLVGWEDYGRVLIGNTSYGTGYGDQGFYRIYDTKFMHPSTSDLYNLIVTDTRAP